MRDQIKKREIEKGKKERNSIEKEKKRKITRKQNKR